MALLEDIGTYLEAESIGTQGTDLFIGMMPDEPDNCVAIYQYSGLAPVKAMTIVPGEYVMEQPRVNVMVRNSSFQNAQAKAQAVFDALGGYSAGNILFIDALQSPYQLGPDQNNRQLIGCNFEVTKAI